MIRGQEPGSGKSEITWTKIPSTILTRMKNDSLIHLFTRKKTINRRTKLLNNHLREHAHQTISYPDYIKVKTAVLRTLSDDEETSDDSIVSDEHDYEKPHVHTDNSKTSALRTLLKDMMLDSQSSSEEFQEKKMPKRNKLRNKIKQKNSKFSPSNPDNNNKQVIVKRPRGRPRKNHSTPDDSGTKSIDTFFTTNNTKIKSSQQKLQYKGNDNDDDLTADIVTIIVDNNENSDASNISNLRDPLGHNNLTPIKITPGKISDHSHDQDSHIYEKISKMISDGVEPQIAAVASKIYSTDDDSDNGGKFLSSKTIDCDDSTDQESLDKNKHVSEGNLIHDNDNNDDDDDDMFEEEKIITQEELIIGNGRDNMFKESTNIVDSKEEPIVFTQEFDTNNHDNVNNIEDYVEQVIKKFDEKFSDKLREQTNNKGLPEGSENLVITQDKFNGHERDHQVVHELEKTSGKIKINSEVSRKIQQSSPKTPADVKRNLMASLNNLNIEKSITNDDEISSLDAEDSQPDDLYLLPPPDSGIDEDSETVLPQESPKSIKNDLKKMENNYSPLKKKLPNLKITCTQVVKSKYMIIKNKQEDKSPIKSLPQAIENLNSSKKSLNAFENEENNDCSLHYSDDKVDNYYNNILSFREQLNNYDSDYNDDNDQENERKILRRNPISLTIPSESESLKYVLNSLSGREHYVRYPNQDEFDIVQGELLMGESLQFENDSENEVRGCSILPRPMSIPEFIEASDFVPLDVHPSFTLADIGEDEDIYLMEIPKTILKQDLEGQMFKLTERKIIIANGKYDIQTREGGAMSCILHCGDDRHIYKTGIIEPIGHIVVTRKVRDDDGIKIPKLQLKSSITVPFPKNIKTRNSFVQTEHSMQIETDKHNDEGQKVKSIDSMKRKLTESDRIEDEYQEFKKRKIFIEKEEYNELIHHNMELSKAEKEIEGGGELSIEEQSIHENEDIREELINKECKKIKKRKKSKKRENSVEKQDAHSNSVLYSNINEEFTVKKKNKKSKKRKKLREERESIDNSYVNQSEVEFNFKAKKMEESCLKYKYGHESEETKRENEDEITIPKRSFYDQMMDDSD